MRILIPIHEFEITYARSSGPGGQNVNKVNSKCVLRWNVPTSPSLEYGVRSRFLERYASRLTTEGDLILTSDRYRDQKRNFEDCLDKLHALVESVARPPKPRRATKPTRSSQRRRRDAKKALSEKKANRRGNWS